jgi:solute carrier family 35 (UDP-xylose/UDP-N-acetylglucosamine transporter), member B4
MDENSKAIIFTFIKEWVLVFSLIFGGCCSNVYSLELLTKSVPSSGNLITLAQFVFVAGEGFISALEFRNGWFRLKKRSVPLWNWFVMVVIFWTVSVLNNYALGFNIPMPLHIIFRSASLMVSMLVGWSVFGRSFTLQQVIGVMMVTVGVIVSTIASSSLHIDSNLSEFLLGLGILVLALVMSCFLGQYQQIIYSTYGRHWKEGMFYNHILGLPAFLLFYEDLSQQIALYNDSALISAGDLIQRTNVLPEIFFNTYFSYLDQFRLPQMWFFLLLNVTTQCIFYLI